MTNRKTFSGKPGTQVIFYIIAFYILASLAWWSYLLIANNHNSFLLEKERLKGEFTRSYAEGNFDDFAPYVKLKQKHKKQIYLVAGEGVAFLFLLGLGFFRINKGFREEVALAKQQRNFLLSITHELNSPMAAAKLALETLEKRKLDAETSSRLVRNALSDLNRLQSLVEDVLLAARLDSPEFEFNIEPLDASRLMKTILQRYVSLYPDRKITVQIKEGIILHADRKGLESLVTNLLENALKYSGDSATIGSSLRHDNDRIALTISDEGVGIPDKEKKLIFNKFYRIGTEETRSTKGTGLGLYIVKKVADGMAARISVLNNEPRGTIFTVTFPAKYG